MRKLTIPHTVKWVAVCMSCIVGSLIFQGCGGDEPSQEANPYAELDAAFPNGRVAITDVATRAQDKEYMAKISDGAQKFSDLSAALAKVDAELAHIRKEMAKSLTLKMGETVPEALLEDALQKVPLYRETLAQRAAAAEALEAQRRENMAMIRNKAKAAADAYDAMRAEADAKAREAGLPVRGEQTTDAPVK